MGKQQKQGGEVFNLKLGEETNLLSGSSFYDGGAMFQRGRCWGGGGVYMIKYKLERLPTTLF